MMKRNKSYLAIFYLILFIVLALNVSSLPGIDFTEPTPANNKITTNTSVEINISVIANITDFKFNWNGVNYTFYDNTSLVLMMNFENLSSLGENDSKAVDVSINNRNNATCSAPYCPKFNSSGGKFAGAYEFNGSTNFSITNYNDFHSNATFSISMWVKPYDNAPTGRAILDNFNYPSNKVKGYSLSIFSGSLQLMVGNGANSYTSLTSSISTNKWSLITTTFNNGNILIYIDGQQAASGSHGSNISYDASQNITIGGPIISSYESSEGFYSNSFNGSIDEVRIYNRTLTAAEIQQHYFSNLKKYDAGKWNFYTNQSKNSTAGLTDGTYTYYGYAKDIAGNENVTETRNLIISSTAITSAQSGLWNDSSTWASGILPHSGNNTLIIGSHTVTIVNGSYSSGNITINSNATLKIDATNGPVLLTIDSGNTITNAGSLVMVNGSDTNTITINSSQTGKDNRWTLSHNGTQADVIFNLTNGTHFVNAGFLTNLSDIKYSLAINKKIYLDNYTYAQDFQFLINGSGAELVLSPGLSFEYKWTNSNTSSGYADVNNTFDGELKVQQGTLTAVGTAANRITITTLDYMLSRWASAIHIVSVYGGSNRNINLKYCNLREFQDSVYFYNLTASFGDHIQIENCEFSSNLSWLGTGSYAGASGIVLLYSIGGGGEANYFKIRNNWIEHTDWEGIDIFYSKNILVENNTIINLRSSDSSNAIWIASGCSTNTSTSCSSEVENITVRGNFIAGGNRSHYTELVNTSGPLTNKSYQESNGIYVSGINGTSLNLYSGVKNVLIEKNILYNIDNRAISGWAMQGTTIQNNIFYKNGNRAGSRNATGAGIGIVKASRGNKVMNNIIVGGYNGIEFSLNLCTGGDFREGNASHTNLLYNNIIAHNTNNGIYGMYTDECYFQSDTIYNLFYNNTNGSSPWFTLNNTNINISNPQFLAYEFINGTADSAGTNTLTDAGMFSGKNLSGRKIVISYGAGFNQVRTISSNNDNTLTVDSDWIYPLDTTSVYEILPDFHHLYGSPAIDAGITNGNVTDDFDGNTRPYSKDANNNGIAAEYDIGTYEYSGCVENWTCSDWGACSSGTKTKTCTDANSCGTTAYRPSISDSCATSSGSSSGGGGSGSGGGGGAAPKQNTVSRYYDIVTAGSTVEMPITKPDFDLTQVSFIASNQLEKATVSVEKIQTAPSVEKPSGNVYGYYKIENTNINNNDMSSAAIDFKVTKSWLYLNNLDENRVSLNRYAAGSWSRLPTVKTSETSTEIYYEATTPWFSLFAITAEKAEAKKEETAKNEISESANQTAIEKPSMPYISSLKKPGAKIILYLLGTVLSYVALFYCLIFIRYKLIMRRIKSAIEKKREVKNP